ncbi:hypothetical protein ACH6CV_05750 [Bacillota bacterium Meth-B3]
MLRNHEKQGAMEIVILEQMIPEVHLLRRIDRAIDFSFIYKLCEPLYRLDNGRPAIRPELLFRMIFMLGRANMREQSFLTAAVQNMNRIVSPFFRTLSLLFLFPSRTPCHAVA